MLLARVQTERGSAILETPDHVLAAGGDRWAFERLYRSHVDRVFSICARISGDRVRAEELTQDVFVRAWEKLPQFRGESAFGTWLHRLAVNIVLNDRRVEKRSQERFDDVEDLDSLGQQRESTHIPSISIDLEAAISTLPSGARRVFILHDVEGYRHEEIATMLGVTTGGTKAQLHRARLLLRRALQR